MTIIDGKATAAKIKEEIAQRVKDIVAAGGKRRSLCRPRERACPR